MATSAVTDRLRRRLVAFLAIGVTATLSACVPHSVFTERATLSDDLVQRSGHGLRTDTEAASRLPPGIDTARQLTEDDAVAIALWNNAAFLESLSKLGLSRGELAQAGLLANPTLSVLFPLGPKQLEFAASFPLESLWLRPLRVDIAKLDAERVANDLVQSGLDLMRDVRLALSDFALARDRVQTAHEAVVVRDRIAEITSARERAGENSVLDVEAQRAEAVRARDEAERLEYDVTLASQRLLFLLGLTGVVDGVDVSVSPLPAADPSADELERRALASRPDVRASELAVEAATKRAGLAVAEIFALSGIADSNGSGKHFEIGPGMSLPLPIFDQNQAGRSRADAELERALWNYVGTRQRVMLEVRSAHVRCRQAIEAWQRWSTDLVPSLEDLVRSSETAYQIGELSPLNVQENARQLIVARARAAELAADVRRAWAELERSVGTRVLAEGRA